MFSTFLLLLSSIFESAPFAKIYVIRKISFNKKQEYICRDSFPPRMPIPTLFLQSVVRWKLLHWVTQNIWVMTSPGHCLDFFSSRKRLQELVTVCKTVIAKKKRITLPVLNMLIQCVKTDEIQVKRKECTYSNSMQSITINAIRKNTNFIFKALNVVWRIIIRWPFC